MSFFNIPKNHKHKLYLLLEIIYNTITRLNIEEIYNNLYLYSFHYCIEQF